MTKEQSMVKDFMAKFQQETPPKPVIPSYEVRKLRAELILEEALETIYALGFDIGPSENIRYTNICDFDWQINETGLKLENIADGLADLHYVAYCGTAVACGLDMEEIFAEVHRSNMSKLWPVDITAKWPDNTHTWKLTKDEKFYLIKNSSGKVIKSPSYSEANLKPIIEKQKA